MGIEPDETQGAPKPYHSRARVYYLESLALQLSQSTLDRSVEQFSGCEGYLDVVPVDFDLPALFPVSGYFRSSDRQACSLVLLQGAQEPCYQHSGAQHERNRSGV